MFIPLFLKSGVIGPLFREFAVTVAMAIAVSLVVGKALAEGRLRSHVLKRCGCPAGLGYGARATREGLHRPPTTANKTWFAIGKCF